MMKKLYLLQIIFCLAINHVKAMDKDNTSSCSHSSYASCATPNMPACYQPSAANLDECLQEVRKDIASKTILSFLSATSKLSSLLQLPSIVLNSYPQRGFTTYNHDIIVCYNWIIRNTQEQCQNSSNIDQQSLSRLIISLKDLRGQIATIPLQSNKPMDLGILENYQPRQL